MSIESVRNKIIESHPDSDYSKLDDSILQVMKRFEKIVKMHSRDYIPESFWRITARENQTAAQARSAFFEQHKLEYIHKYLDLITDLYDYKAK